MNFQYGKSVNILANCEDYMLYNLNQQREKNMTQGKTFLRGCLEFFQVSGGIDLKVGGWSTLFFRWDNPM